MMHFLKSLHDVLYKEPEQTFFRYSESLSPQAMELRSSKFLFQ